MTANEWMERYKRASDQDDKAEQAHLVQWAREQPPLCANVRETGRPFVGRLRLYFAVASVGTASRADSNAMNKTQGALLTQEALCGSFAGTYAYMPGLSSSFA